MLDGSVYYDISPEITESLAVFPGDTSFRRDVSVCFDGGSGYMASSIHGTVHLGAHVDAPNHYNPTGQGIESRRLDYYLGECQVISVSLPKNHRIKPADLGNRKIMAKRVLFNTGSFPDPNRWNSDFNSLSADLIQMLADRGVILAGIDTPSIDLSDDKILESHQAIDRNNMAILEGIVLSGVPDGIYTLIALPLKIRDADASPVRAVLIGGKRG
jgi:arylformamidase